MFGVSWMMSRFEYTLGIVRTQHLTPFVVYWFVMWVPVGVAMMASGGLCDKLFRPLLFSLDRTLVLLLGPWLLLDCRSTSVRSSACCVRLPLNLVPPRLTIMHKTPLLRIAQRVAFRCVNVVLYVKAAVVETHVQLRLPDHAGARQLKQVRVLRLSHARCHHH